MSITSDELKDRIIAELSHLNLSFDEKGTLVPQSNDKECLRRIHNPSKLSELRKSQDWIAKNISKYRCYFANGSDINPRRITPQLIQVTDKWHGDLFRLARLLWSLPYSAGYGRRLRYLILDSSNQKLIGIFGLQSPPISFPARDNVFDYPKNGKIELINQTMDIYTLGAVPPYNRLLGGKLVALAVVSNEVRKDYWEKYAGSITQMQQRVLPAHLVALTTTSAFGRSSIYNRLRYNGIPIAKSLGYTEGYGNFHLQPLYPIFKEYLKERDLYIQGGYGSGPKRTWQLIRRILQQVSLPGDVLKHGIKREAFLFPLIQNLHSYLEGDATNPDYYDYPFENLAQFWKERWLLPRSERVDGWHRWDNENIVTSLIIER